MNRRRASGSGHTCEGEERVKPNIVFIHAHNTGRRIEPYGFAVPTLRLQALAEEGILYRNAFAAAPTCSPSRTGFLTGCYPHRVGMHGLAHRGFELADYAPHLANQLKRGGYETALAGVEHTARDPGRIGYDRVLGTRDGTATPEGGSAETVHAAEAFLCENHDRPFFLSVGIWETHRPYPEPVPSVRGQDQRYVRPPAGIPDVPETRRDTAAFAASAAILDARVGRVLDSLTVAGLAEDTFVFVFADHGLQFPDHMCNLTDRGLGVFLIARGPEGFSGGLVFEPMVSLLDVAATALDIAGIRPDFDIDGASLSETVTASDVRVHEELFAELTFHAAYEPMRSIRTDRYRYVRRFDDRTSPVLPNLDDSPSKEVLLAADWAAVPRRQELLFDCRLDGDNLVNRVDELSGVRDELSQRLDRWMKRTDDPLATGTVPPPPPGALANDPDGYSPKSEPRPAVEAIRKTPPRPGREC